MLYKGNNKIKKLYKGDELIVQLYKGDEKIFEDFEAIYGFKFTIDTRLRLDGSSDASYAQYKLPLTQTVWEITVDWVRRILTLRQENIR